MSGQRIRMSTWEDQKQFAEQLSRTFGHVSDLVFRGAGRSLIVYLAGIVDEKRIEREIIRPLEANPDADGIPVNSPAVKTTGDYEETVQALLSGAAAIAIVGRENVILANVASVPHRNINRPETETVVQGPREGLVEHLETNIALLRRMLKSDKLHIRTWKIGSVVKTDVRMLYLDGVASDELVTEIAKRISAVQLDAVIESNYLAENIKDRPFSLFPTVQSTERSDVVTEALVKGRVAVLVDNTPFALIFPFTFWNNFQAIEDYYINYSSATFLRAIRALFIILALLLPSLYVAITTYHVEMLPTDLLLSIAASRETSPFPAVVEALIMESIFEALREAIVRLPRILGQAVSVVGALVIGQSIVQAGIISIPMIIVVSVTGIASLMIPRYEMTFAIRIMRMILLVLAGSLGLYGVALGLFFTQAYLTGIQSAGTPYLTPIAPLVVRGLKDFLLRAPLRRHAKIPQRGRSSP